MQEHSGEHLISGLIHGRFGYDNVGFHMGAEEVTIDFNGLLEWKDLMEIEAEANRLIWENEEVYAGFPPKEELADKADASALSGYVTSAQLTEILKGYQKVTPTA